MGMNPETHPAGTASRIDELKAALIEAEARIPRFPDTVPLLLAALVKANAATAAAYEVAAQKVFTDQWSNYGDAKRVSENIRSLATPDQTASLDRLIAEAKADALSGPWEDKPDAMTATVEASYPHITKDYDTYTQALELVSSRRSKGALVALVNHLLAASKKGGV